MTSYSHYQLINQRRNYIQCKPYKRGHIHCLSTLNIQIDHDEFTFHIQLDYVPDRHILTHEVLKKYTQFMIQEHFHCLESLVCNMTEDLNNELLPQWIYLHIHHIHGTDYSHHQASAQDQHPQWNQDQRVNLLMMRAQQHKRTIS